MKLIKHWSFSMYFFQQGEIKFDKSLVTIKWPYTISTFSNLPADHSSNTIQSIMLLIIGRIFPLMKASRVFAVIGEVCFIFKDIFKNLW